MFIISLYSCKPLIKVGDRKSEELFETVIARKIDSGKEKYYLCENLDLDLSGMGLTNVKAKIYIETGQFIFLSMNILGLELGRIMISEDSIKYINRIRKEYFFAKKDDFLRNNEIKLNYDEIENLLIKGLPVGDHFNKKTFFSGLKDLSNEYVYMHKAETDVAMKIYFDKISLLESRIEVNEPKDEFYISAILNEFNKQSSYPGMIDIEYKDRGSTKKIKMKVGKVENKSFSNTSFRINDSYNEISF
jgi:hypothetical protein